MKFPPLRLKFLVLWNSFKFLFCSQHLDFPILFFHIKKKRCICMCVCVCVFLQVCVNTSFYQSISVWTRGCGCAADRQHPHPVSWSTWGPWKPVLAKVPIRIWAIGFSLLWLIKANTSYSLSPTRHHMILFPISMTVKYVIFLNYKIV